MIHFLSTLFSYFAKLRDASLGLSFSMRFGYTSVCITQPYLTNNVTSSCGLVVEITHQPLDCCCIANIWSIFTLLLFQEKCGDFKTCVTYLSHTCAQFNAAQF